MTRKPTCSKREQQTEVTYPQADQEDFQRERFAEENVTIPPEAVQNYGHLHPGQLDQYVTEEQKTEGHGRRSMLDDTMETSKRDHRVDRTYPSHPYASMPVDTFPQQVPWSNPNEICASRQQKENRNLAPKDVVVWEDNAEVHAGRHERSRNLHRHHEAGRQDRPRHSHRVDVHADRLVADHALAQLPNMPHRDELPPRRHDACLDSSSRQRHGPGATVMGFDDRVPGAFLVPGFDAIPQREETHSDDQSVEPSTVLVNARVVDETEERRILREELHQVLEERDQVQQAALLHASTDVEYANAVVAPIVTPIHPNYEESGVRHGVGRKRLAIGALLAIGAAALGLTLWKLLPQDPTSSPTGQPTSPNLLPTSMPIAAPTASPATLSPSWTLPSPPPSPLPTSAPILQTTPPSAPLSTSPPSLNLIPTDLMNLISEVSFDGGVAANNQSTPQFKALNWLAGDANFTIQRYALATLYHSTGGGNSWDQINQSERWLMDADECGGWGGDGPVCSADKKAVKLMLYEGLQGTIPDEIALLSDLAELQLKDSSGLTGSIPFTVARMTKLEKLSLSHNSLTGPLPNMGQLAKLVDASFGQNRLSGPIPSTIGQLPALQTLGLYENELTGPIPNEISGMTNLTAIRLYDNRLTGTIPDISSLISLTSLRLYANDFTGTFVCPEFVNESCLVSCNNTLDLSCKSL